MSDFELSDAVGSLSDYSSATGTLWGIYAAATFAASGFGITMGDRFTFGIAAFLTLGFLAFAIGHFSFVWHHVKVQRTISSEVLDYLERDPCPTAFPQSVRAACRPDNKMAAVTITHIVIDLCVLLIIWSMAKYV
jgi:hypothetical protein